MIQEKYAWKEKFLMSEFCAGVLSSARCTRKSCALRQ
ncbi:hypothetical protein A2U01_0118463, partial [Trifolium medium]|nr:hypothetical protein [Trifolium medium]